MVDGTCDGVVTDGDTKIWKDLNVMHEKTNDVQTQISIAQEQVGMSLRMWRSPATKHRKYGQKRNCIHTAFGQLCGVFFFFFFFKGKKRRETDKHCGVKRDAQREKIKTSKSPGVVEWNCFGGAVGEQEIRGHGSIAKMTKFYDSLTCMVCIDKFRIFSNRKEILFEMEPSAHQCDGHLTQHKMHLETGSPGTCDDF